MTGRRLKLEEAAELLPGDYLVDESGTVVGVTPNGLLAQLVSYPVEEHADGTVSVGEFSVERPATGAKWRGRIVKGAWVETT